VLDVTELLPLIVLLAEHEVDFVLIGGAAGVVQGSSYPTYDVDVAYARDRPNLERLAGALESVSATLRGAPKGIPFILDAATLEKGGNFTFDTKLGSLDVLADAEGSPPYERLRDEARVISLGGHDVRVASLDHLIRMKESVGRTKDKLMATEYRVLSDEEG
jgi:hypothetical protein